MSAVRGQGGLSGPCAGQVELEVQAEVQVFIFVYSSTVRLYDYAEIGNILSFFG